MNKFNKESLLLANGGGNSFIEKLIKVSEKEILVFFNQGQIWLTEVKEKEDTRFDKKIPYLSYKSV
jgi:hypothetical protein